MSYNIDRWKTKELTDFQIALTALEPKEDYLDAPTTDAKTGELTFTGRSGGFELRGQRSGDFLSVSHIKNYGEASGTMQEFLNEDVFPHSIGTLIAVCVWEGGDSITRLTVKGGVVTEENIEL